MATELKSSDRVLYFYGVTQSSANSIKQSGVDMQSPLEPIDCAGFVCWVSRVSALEFERDLARNMENLDWLATASVAHQRAIGVIAKETEILPARFGTIFRSEASLRKHIRERAEKITKDFQRVKGADEWGVKVFAAKTVPAAPLPKVRSGKDYLSAKAALLPKRRPQSSANGDFAEFEDALRGVALESATVGSVSGGQPGLRFQTSLLVKKTDQQKLQSVLNKFSERWQDMRKIECTGPWPPYSFVSREPGVENE